MGGSDDGNYFLMLLLVGGALFVAFLGGLWWTADHSAKRYQYVVFLNPINFVTLIGLALLVAGGIGVASQNNVSVPRTTTETPVQSPPQTDVAQPASAAQQAADAEQEDADLPDATVLSADDYHRMSCREMRGVSPDATPETWCRDPNGMFTDRGHVVIAPAGEGAQQ